MTMRPPMSSDEEDDYDGFSFGTEFEKPEKKVQPISSQWLLKQQQDEDDLNYLVHSVKIGDLDSIKQALLKRYGSEVNINYDDYLKDGWTLMLHAVFNIQFNVVSYLINQKANVNHQADSLTPLMLICKYDANDSDMDAVLNITKLLLDNGALVNIRDRTGYTPLMYACTYGNKKIVELLLHLSAIEASDNSGFTSLHYAVQSKHIDIVKMLLDAGAETEVFNAYGLKPADLAISLGCTELQDLFPVEIVDDIPIESEQYRTYMDLAPTIFPDHEQSIYIPEYSQDIPTMLKGMRAENCTKQVYNAKISLAEFLTIDDKRLQSIGIEFEYQRKRILQGLLKFHRHPYSPKSIEIVSKTQNKNMYQYYEMYANYLKHLVMMKAAIAYLMTFGGPKNVPQNILKDICVALNNIQKDVTLLEKHMKQLSKFSASNPLFIGPIEKPKPIFKGMFGPLLKYSIIIGMGLFISYRFLA